MTVDTTRIARKADQARTALTAIKSGAVTLAADDTATAETWGTFALRVAEAEGAVQAWARLQHMVEFQASKGADVVENDIKALAFDMMSAGADDTWSGRGNDLKRARFDGLRSACTDMQWL